MTVSSKPETQRNSIPQRLTKLFVKSVLGDDDFGPKTRRMITILSAKRELA